MAKKKRVQYLAIIDGKGDVWGAVIPDFPGCHGGGKTPHAAKIDATSALREFAADMIADGEEIPPPSDYEDIVKMMKREGLKGGLMYVPLFLDSYRSVSANISLDACILDAIDTAAQERGLTRSAFLASAAMDKIEGEQ